MNMNMHTPTHRYVHTYNGIYKAETVTLKTIANVHDHKLVSLFNK